MDVKQNQLGLEQIHIQSCFFFINWLFVVDQMSKNRNITHDNLEYKKKAANIHILEAGTGSHLFFLRHKWLKLEFLWQLSVYLT